MTTAFFRSICSTCRKRIHPALSTSTKLVSFEIENCHQSPFPINQTPQRRLLNTFAPKHTSDEAQNLTVRSVIAYNLSEKLKIENAKNLLDDFNEYQVAEIPHDLHEEAIMLSFKRDSQTENKESLSNRDNHDIFLFREGSIVFWGVPHDQQRRILYSLSSLKINPYSSDLIQDEREHIYFLLNESYEKSRLTRDVIHLAANQEPSSLRLDQFTVSHAIALSVKLGIWESKLDQYIDSVGWVTNRMQEGKSIDLTRDQVFRKTGEIYHLKHRINLSSELLDLPDVYWDRHDQEILFLSLTSFLNIKKRTAVINEKLNNCCELMNLLASHMNDKHHVRLEWMIIALIMVEVGFEFVSFFR